MNTTTIWAIFLICGLLTFVMRAVFIVGWGRVRFPAALQQALRFVPIAVLIALIVPDTVLQNGQLFLHPSNFRLVAALVAVGDAAVTRSIFLTIGAGFGVLFLLEWLT